MLVAFDGGGGTSSPAGVPSSMTVEVDPDRLYATAHQFDAAANTLTTWIQSNRFRFSIDPAGLDTVSTGLAEFFTDAAQNTSTGALATAQLAANNLYAAAEAMRAAAVSYGLTDTTGSADLTATDPT